MSKEKFLAGLASIGLAFGAAALVGAGVGLMFGAAIVVFRFLT